MIRELNPWLTNEELARRLREVLARLPNVEEKKLFRGVAFMANGRMGISVGKDALIGSHSSGI